MATEFRWFRNNITGRVGKYPEHFTSQPGFEEINGYDALCLECLPEEVIVDSGEAVNIQYDENETKNSRSKRRIHDESKTKDTEDN